MVSLTHRPSHSLGLHWLPEEPSEPSPSLLPIFFPFSPNSSAPYLHQCLGPSSRKESRQTQPRSFSESSSLWVVGEKGVCPRFQSVRSREPGPCLCAPSPWGLSSKGGWSRTGLVSTPRPGTLSCVSEIEGTNGGVRLVPAVVGAGEGLQCSSTCLLTSTPGPQAEPMAEGPGSWWVHGSFRQRAGRGSVEASVLVLGPHSLRGAAGCSCEVQPLGSRLST